MAVLKATLDVNLKPLKELAKQFPDFRGGWLAYMGREARHTLKKDYLSGQEINLRKFPRDSKGRYTITSDVNKRRTSVKVYAYPANLFERGRMLRSGRKEAGKYIITRKLKQAVASKQSSYIGYIENNLLQRDLKKVGLK